MLCISLFFLSFSLSFSLSLFLSLSLSLSSSLSFSLSFSLFLSSLMRFSLLFISHHLFPFLPFVPFYLCSLSLSLSMSMSFFFLYLPFYTHAMRTNFFIFLKLIHFLSGKTIFYMCFCQPSSVTIWSALISLFICHVWIPCDLGRSHLLPARRNQKARCRKGWGKS